MCFWLPLRQTDRNTCMVSVTNFFWKKSKNKKVITVFYRICFEFLPVFDQFIHEANSVLSIIESQLGLLPVGDMKAKLGPCLGVSRSLI
jgi:hypothetical protein